MAKASRAASRPSVTWGVTAERGAARQGCGGGGVVPRVVLAEQILAVIVPVRRPHQRMDVIAGRLVVVERHPVQMIELDQDDWALNPIIEDAVVVDAADPYEVGLGDMLGHLIHLDASVAVAY